MLMAKPSKAFATRRPGEASTVGTWRMVAKPANEKFWISVVLRESNILLLSLNFFPAMIIIFSSLLRAMGLRKYCRDQNWMGSMDRSIQIRNNNWFSEGIWGVLPYFGLQLEFSTLRTVDDILCSLNSLLFSEILADFTRSRHPFFHFLIRQLAKPGMASWWGVANSINSGWLDPHWQHINWTITMKISTEGPHCTQTGWSTSMEINSASIQSLLFNDSFFQVDAVLESIGDNIAVLEMLVLCLGFWIQS